MSVPSPNRPLRRQVKYKGHDSPGDGPDDNVADFSGATYSGSCWAEDASDATYATAGSHNVTDPVLLGHGSSDTRMRWASMRVHVEPSQVLVVNHQESDACHALCLDAEAADIVAFDAEWCPDTGGLSDNPVSIIQLAFPDSKCVYVVQLGRLGGHLPPAAKKMLSNPKVTKIGFAVGVKDSAKFVRSGIPFVKESVVDVRNSSANALRTRAESLSLKRASELLLGYKLKKSWSSTCSDWATENLTSEQIYYAAFDAWVTLRLYYNNLEYYPQ